MDNKTTASNEVKHESELLRVMSHDPADNFQAAGQMWVALWIAGVLLGSVLIGRCIATTEWPWMSIVAAQKWTGAPVCILV
ncbi:hypothetical protein, partial [Paraburkholderia sp. SIMBA_053]